VLTDELRDAASLHVLGLLEGDEALAFAGHLERCPACRDEVRQQAELSAQLALDAPLRTPPAGLRERVLAGLPKQEYVVTRGSDGCWMPSGVPGIDIKPLAGDRASGTRSFLLRLAPGAVLPAHQHREAEHCYVIEGDVFDHEHSLTAGDYELRFPGSGHASVSSHSGAVVLIVAGRHDEHT
jgi:anti-sigma factor ChrR (cupin superfamily)